MCGKFTQMMSWSELVEHADFLRSTGAAETVTPMRFAFVIRLDERGKRESVRMRWGLVPPWEENPTAGVRHIHARVETIDSKRTFREAFRERRGLVVVKTFNEGEEVGPSKTRQHVISPNDGKPLAIAVIWERWEERNSRMSLLSFAMVTVPANRLIARITDRMPAIVRPDDWSKWLGEEPATADELKAMLNPFEGDWTMEPEKSGKAPPKKRDPDPTLFE